MTAWVARSTPRHYVAKFQRYIKGRPNDSNLRAVHETATGAVLR